MTTETRIEKDSMGELTVPAHALYGAQTQRAINNFQISGRAMPEDFIKALVLIKAAAATANCELTVLPKNVADAIFKASQNLLEQPGFMQHFPLLSQLIKTKKA